jgi:hypothetical protein
VALLRGPGEPTPEEAALWEEICAGQAMALGGAGRGRDSGLVRLQNLRAAIADHRIGLDGVRATARWVHESPDRHAALLRDGHHDSPDTFLRPENALRYREAAAAWQARVASPGVGPESGPDAGTVPTPGANTAPAGLDVFDALYQSLGRTGAAPDPLHPDPRVAEAIREALRAIGGRQEISQSTRFTLPDIRRRFIATYERTIR